MCRGVGMEGVVEGDVVCIGRGMLREDGVL